MKKTILVIEDDKDIRDSVVELLDWEGYQVHSAENGHDGLSFLGECEKLPDLILLDLQMPVMDGFEFCSRKKNEAKLSHIPVIIMSADGHIRDKKARTEADAYLKKPIDIDQLIKAIGEYLTK